MDQFDLLINTFELLKIKFEIRTDNNYKYVFVGEEKTKINLEHLLQGSRKPFKFKKGKLISY